MLIIKDIKKPCHKYKQLDPNELLQFFSFVLPHFQVIEKSLYFLRIKTASVR